MRVVIALLASPALTAGAWIIPAAHAGPAAHAADPPVAEVRLAYQHPEITEGGAGVTWHWMLSNNGSGGAATVVATQRVSAGQKVVAVSKPCTMRTSDVVCRFASIRPGEQRTGWIKTIAPAGGGTLRVNAQVTWMEGGLKDLPPVDATGPSVPAGQPVSSGPAADSGPAAPTVSSGRGTYAGPALS
jgi:hypothetical protein